MIEAPFRLERHFALHEFSAKRLLSSSDCDAIALDDVIAGFDDDVAARWKRLSLGYTESRGLPAVRHEVAADYDGVSADDVLMVVPEEGILLSMWALVRPGTPVIVTTPAYQSLVEVARAQGARLHVWAPRRVAETLCFDVDDLAAIVDALDDSASRRAKTGPPSARLARPNS